MSFQLPDRPDHPIYREVMEHVRNAPAHEAAWDFRYWCENDYWFFARHCLQVGQYRCDDPCNDHRGRPWLDHRWLFERCRDVQFEDDERFFRWPRGHFKTSLVTVGKTIWDFTQQEALAGGFNCLILTYKQDVTGAALMRGFRSEFEDNPLLHFHWPEVFWRDPRRESSLWTTTSIILRQPDGHAAREPSILVASLENQPTSQHYRKIVVDDAVTREVVKNEAQIQSVSTALKQTTFLGIGGVTKRVYVGTFWSQDDPWRRAERQGVFTTNPHFDCFDEHGRGVLWSKEALAKYERDAGRFEFAAQMRGTPIKSSEMIFLEDWFQDYGNPPDEEAEGKNVYIFSDKGGSKEHSDYSVLAAVGLGGDKQYYLLDLRRDHWTTNEYDETLLSMMDRWSPLGVYIEQFGAMTDVERLRDKMRERKWRRFRVEPLPPERGMNQGISKDSRITRLQSSMSFYRWWFPKAVGYRPKDDSRDCLQVFYDDEYVQWAPNVRLIHDDMLDTLAMALNSELRLIWPRDPAADKRRRRKDSFRRTASRGHSSWVA